MVEGEELGAIARRVIDSNQFMTISTADEEGVPWVSPAWYALAEYREIFWIRPHIYLPLLQVAVSTPR
jgi:Pyridoxamine 5'-phosphate oxidase